MCVCVCGRVREGLEGGNMGYRSREGVRWIVPPFISSIHARLGTLGGGFRVTVWVLSWIYKSGERFMSFSPSVAPYTIPCLPPPSFHSRLHNHCTAHKGLSSQVQPRLARIKERFQLKMFFPSLFFCLPTLVFPFLLMSSNSFFYLHLLHTFHICFLRAGPFPSLYILFLI